MVNAWLCFAVAAVAAVAMVPKSMADCSCSGDFESDGGGRRHDYGEALSKCILFFEGQRSGKLPAFQRLTWREDSALNDGHDIGVDLVGGYYDAGDNVKFGFPMAFTTTMLAWSVIEFGKDMGHDDLQHAMGAVRWGTDYLLKTTAQPDRIYVQVGEPYADHNCWERPEDMDTPRSVYTIDAQKPGSEVAAETAAALAAASIVFKRSDPNYAEWLLQRAMRVFDFANEYKGSYSASLGKWVCPFYCDFSGYEDELVWGAAWLYKATNNLQYWNYVASNDYKLDWSLTNFGNFGWDDKHAGISVLLYKDFLANDGDENHKRADKFACTVLPESTTLQVSYSPGGLLFKPGGSNLQHPTASSFLLVVLARYLLQLNGSVQCDMDVPTPPARLIEIAKHQVDYILGDNPLNMSYMVGYGNKFPQRIHHRGSSLPSVGQHRQHIACKDGTPYFQSHSSNPNLLIGALVGGPDENDAYPDNRADFVHSEPTTYINAPMVGTLAYFRAHG